MHKVQINRNIPPEGRPRLKNPYETQQWLEGFLERHGSERSWSTLERHSKSQVSNKHILDVVR